MDLSRMCSNFSVKMLNFGKCKVIVRLNFGKCKDVYCLYGVSQLHLEQCAMFFQQVFLVLLQ